MRKTKSEYFEELTDAMFKHGYGWAGKSGVSLLRMKKSFVFGLANVLRYMGWDSFVFYANELGLVVYKLEWDK